MPFSGLLDEIVELVRVDAERLGCLDEVLHAREIVSRGTSAQSQIRTYEQARLEGADEAEALRTVVDWLIGETVRGTDLANVASG